MIHNPLLREEKENNEGAATALFLSALRGRFVSLQRHMPRFSETALGRPSFRSYYELVDYGLINNTILLDFT